MFDRKYKDYTGQRFNRLVVIKRHSSDSKHVRWICKCDCGNETVQTSQNLIGFVKSCGCLKKEKKLETGPKSQYFKGCGELYLTFFNIMKGSANRRHLSFNITIEYLWDLFLKQNRRCALTNELLTMPTRANGSKLLYSASLDRIDSSIGYEIGNVHWVSKDINLMKQKFTSERFLELCEQVVNYAKTKKSIS